MNATQEGISDTARNRYKRQARKRHPRCYMCGTDLDFEEQDLHRRFTLEHIWPRRYGGNSSEENLLPACASCNNHKKRDFATWAMTGIQALVLGFSPSAAEYDSVDGSNRFALHYFAARQLAVSRRCNLKNAFLHLEPWRELRVTNDSEVADFFNLANHRVLAEVQ